MKSSSILQCAALVGAVSASSDAYLWTVDAGQVKQSANQVTSTDSFTAERILARRKGVTDSAYMHITDESVLSDLNQYGGWQQPLFGARPSEHPAKIFIRISGYEGSVSEFNTLPDLWIEQPETTLVDTFEAKFDVKNICEYHIVPRHLKDSVSIKYTYFDSSEACLPQSEIESRPSLLVITATVPTASSLAGKGISSFHKNLVHLSATDNIESTLLVLPASSKLKKPKKTELKKRAERPLDLPDAEVFPQIGTSASNSSSNYTLPRNIPLYFQSQAACENITNSCVGHGECVKAHGNLYKCLCGRTTIRPDKTVQWGGNACQKKDISSEFILFAVIGVFLTAIIAGAIGMMFDMGSQELPSVIGAGVVGTRAQK